MKNIEKQAADENTKLQIQGATELLRKARTALENALCLGGDVGSNMDGNPLHLPALMSELRQTQRLAVAMGYRQKHQFSEMSKHLGIHESEVLTALMEHFEKDRKLADAWLLAESQFREQT